MNPIKNNKISIENKYFIMIQYRITRREFFEKKLVIISVIIITILSIFNISKAETTETFELYLETNNKKIEPGKEFSADIILDNIAVTSGDQGIAGYTTKIVYDANVLELVSVKSNEWEVMENEGNIIVNTNTSGNSVNGNNINTSKNVITGNVEKPSTSKQPSLPYAGVRNVVIGIAVVISVIAIYFYIKYRSAYDEKK